MYPDKEKLKEHRERHTKTTNPLECVECNKIFKARNPLVRHMATHTLEKFFVCEFCGKQFTHHSSFKMHMVSRCVKSIEKKSVLFEIDGRLDFENKNIRILTIENVLHFVNSSRWLMMMSEKRSARNVDSSLDRHLI